MATIFLTITCHDTEHLQQCLDSVKSQTHSDWIAHVTLDAIPASGEWLLHVKQSFGEKRIIFYTTAERRYALYNQIHAIHNFCPHDAIVGKLDGDDYLSDPGALAAVSAEYDKDPQLDVLWTQFKKTTGAPTANKDIPADADVLSYGWSTSHFQTFRKRMIWAVRHEVFIDPEINEPWRCSCDHALYLPILVHAKRRKFLNRVCYIYRASGQFSDNTKDLQAKTAQRIRAVNKADGGRPKQQDVLFFVNGPGYAAQGGFNNGERRPPVGVLSMLAHLRQRRHNVVLVDRFMDPTWWPQQDTMRKASVIGVYCSTPNALDARWIMQSARQSGFRGLIAAGGPHAILWPDEVRSWGADLVCTGEADYAISRIVEDGVIPDMPKRIEQLDTIPYPAYDTLIQQRILGKYNLKWPFGNEGGIFSLNTSRGCPFGCAFCDVNTIWGNKYHAQGVQRVMLDVEESLRLGAKGVYFREDNFCCDEFRLSQICEALIGKYGVKKFPWACEIRADKGCKSDLVLRMAQAGCKGFYVGAESGSDRVLKSMNKGITVKQLEQTCQNAAANKVCVALSMIDNFPGEKDDDRVQTAEFLKRIKVRHVWRAKYRKTWADYQKEGVSPVQASLKQLAETPEQLQGTGVKVSVIITCKGRLPHLKATMKEHLKHEYPFEHEFIVVDYGCPDGTFDWIRLAKNPRLRAIKVKSDVEYFNLSRARNIGAAHAKGQILVFCDADVYPKDDLWLKTITSQVCNEGVVMTRPHWKRGGCGICAVRTPVFHAVRGFDEAMHGWGFEDIDFRGRVEKVGQVVAYDARLIAVLGHAQEQRIMFYENKKHQQTNTRNRQIAQKRVGLPNPKEYGKATVELWPPI